jgi:hypothetical protein
VEHTADMTLTPCSFVIAVPEQKQQSTGTGCLPATVFMHAQMRLRSPAFADETPQVAEPQEVV